MKILFKHILDNYKIAVKQIKHVPIGEVANSYILFSESKIKYFLKIYPSSRIVDKNVKKRHNSHKIAHFLYHQEGIDQVTYPIKTKTGDFKSLFGDTVLVIWTFVEGKMANEKKRKTESFLEGLANLLGRIHNSTSNLKLDSIEKFSFDLEFRKDLLFCIKEATACTTSKDKSFNKLQKLINQYAEVILESLVYIEELSLKLQDKDEINYVLCHSDPIIHNIIIDSKNKIHLVDWDGAVLAPFEQDIWFYILDDKFELFFQKYKEASGFKTLDEDIIVFLFYERTLADLTDWIYRILFEEITPDQIKSDFKELEEDCWPVLSNIKELENKLRLRVRTLGS